MWNQHWERGAFNTQEHRALINAYLEIVGSNLAGKRTLEVGAGRGIDSIRLAQHRAEAHLVDFAINSFNVSRSLARQAGVQMHSTLAEGAGLPFPSETFDLVFSQGLLEHGENTERLLPEQTRVVKRGGLVIVDVPQLYSLQTIIKRLMISAGKWSYGEETSFSVKQIKTIMREFGLEPIKVYGWELLPVVNLGLRTRFRKFLARAGAISSDSTTVAEWEPDRSFRDRFEQLPVASYLLNNVGVVGKRVT